ncbi:DCL family protein [Streptomyces sp. YGL11-2]|uniref:DCL family protein n=1 Tax=Streptomyces sp. YGL11-2 TaxID=3414028 RepID=UPI003CEDF291
MRKSFNLGGVEYTTKKAAGDACRQILYAYPAGSVVADRKDEEFLRDLLSLHPEYPDKAGPGVDQFTVDRTPHGNIGFHVVRADGTREVFSYLACLTHPDHRTNVLGTMRLAVSAQIYSFRATNCTPGTPIRCAITGETITWDDIHIDHEEPQFVDLAENFANDHGGFEAIAVESRDTAQRWHLRDHEAEWQEYHERHATLRIVSKAANLARGRG